MLTWEEEGGAVPAQLASSGKRKARPGKLEQSGLATFTRGKRPRKAETEMQSYPQVTHIQLRA